MSVDAVILLRPSSDTGEAHRAALERIKSAIVATRAQLDGLLAQRADMIAKGTVKDVMAAEAELAHGRIELEQMTALADHITAGIPDLERAERNAALAASLKTFDARRDKLTTAILEEYPPLAKRIAEICAEQFEYCCDYVNLHRVFGNFMARPPFGYATSRDDRGVPLPLYAIVSLPDVRDANSNGHANLSPLWRPRADVSGMSDAGSQAEIIKRSMREGR